MTEKVLVLRTCDADLKSYCGFQWPATGPVSCEDFDPAPVCGYGLHGLLWGEGAGELLDWSDDAKWLVVEVPADEIVKLGNKVKFPRGTVVFCGDRPGATTFVAATRPGAIVGHTAIAGNRGTATAGYGGRAIAGNRGTATAGNRGTATVGDDGTATAGNGGTATAGNRGVLILRDGRGLVHVARVGDPGISPCVAYRLDDNGSFIRKESENV